MNIIHREPQKRATLLWL